MRNASKIIISGIAVSAVSFISITLQKIEFTNTALTAVASAGFVLGCLAGSYLILGEVISDRLNRNKTGMLSIVIRSCAFFYAVSLIPFAVLMCYYIYLVICYI